MPLEESGDLTAVRVDSYPDVDTKSYTDFSQGIPFIVSGMKTLLETGKAMAGG